VLGHLLHVVGYGSFGNFGNLGVWIFFLISGFLITGLLVAEKERTSTIGLLKFYFRRTLRIFPLSIFIFWRFPGSRTVVFLPIFIIAFNLLYDHSKIFPGFSISAMNICIASSPRLGRHE